jgi:hypothetical protein
MIIAVNLLHVDIGLFLNYFRLIHGAVSRGVACILALTKEGKIRNHNRFE